MTLSVSELTTVTAALSVLQHGDAGTLLLTFPSGYSTSEINNNSPDADCYHSLLTHLASITGIFFSRVFVATHSETKHPFV